MSFNTDKTAAGWFRNFLFFALLIFLCTTVFAPRASALIIISDDETISSDRFSIYALSSNAVSRDITVGDNVTVYVSSTDVPVNLIAAGIYAHGEGAFIGIGDNLTVSADGRNAYGVTTNSGGAIWAARA